jgi:hypothetical protein
MLAGVAAGAVAAPMIAGTAEFEMALNLDLETGETALEHQNESIH